MPMKLAQYRGLWGSIDLLDGHLARSPYRAMEDLFPELERLGYDGVELHLKLILHVGKEKVKSLLKQHGLKCIILIFTDGDVVPGAGPEVLGGPYPGFTAPTRPGETDKDKLVRTHLQIFKESVEAAQEFGPTLVNCHTLKDYFTMGMADQFFTEAVKFEEEKGYFVCHETHRNRFLYSPWVARDFLPRHPKLKLTASRWVWRTSSSLR